jgi:two-component system sensor histidine kinase/response regulator
VLSKVLVNAWESYGDARRRSAHLDAHGLFDRPKGREDARDAGRRPGDGIAEEIRDRMFEPFVSSKRTVGVGMGLTIARHSLRSLSGEVTMVSRPEGGATAILVHPVKDPRQKDAQEQDED